MADIEVYHCCHIVRGNRRRVGYTGPGFPPQVGGESPNDPVCPWIYCQDLGYHLPNKHKHTAVKTHLIMVSLIQ